MQSTLTTTGRGGTLRGEARRQAARPKLKEDEMSETAGTVLRASRLRTELVDS
jgi:hypothetical protein